jgi:hypothetical protein
MFIIYWMVSPVDGETSFRLIFALLLAQIFSSSIEILHFYYMNLFLTLLGSQNLQHHK